MGDGISKRGDGISEIEEGIWDARGGGEWEMGDWIWEMGDGIWEIGYGRSKVGYGVREMGDRLVEGGGFVGLGCLWGSGDRGSSGRLDVIKDSGDFGIGIESPELLLFVPGDRHFIAIDRGGDMGGLGLDEEI